ncbi:hypothetical protein VPH35_006305 [Triticum aestivum]
MEKDAVTLGFVANNYSSKAWIQDPTQFSFHQFDPSSVEYNGTNCVYRSSPATGLGILGVFLVFINQVIVAAYASGWCLCLCCCCPCWTKPRHHPLRLLLVRQVRMIMAMATFIMGVTESSREEAPISKTPTSYACREPGTIGSFPTVSLSSLIAVVLGIASSVAGGASGTGRQQSPTGPTAGADQEAEHVSLATMV